jgi:hypothetical protein
MKYNKFSFGSSSFNDYLVILMDFECMKSVKFVKPTTNNKPNFYYIYRVKTFINPNYHLL